MCIWCAYSGNSPAFPLLLSAAEKAEGLWGGTFTGFVTVDEQGLHYDKCKGTLEEWKKQFSGRNYPGNCGLYHCRTNSGGNGLWAHPFVSSDDMVALAAQGSAGRCSKEPKLRRGNELLAQGIKFRCALHDIETQKYPQLSDGSFVHTGEIECESIAQYYRETHDPVESLRRTAAELPSEAVMVCIFRDRPGFLYAATLNQRLAVIDSDEGIWLGTSLETLSPDLFPVTEVAGNRVIEAAPGHLRIEKVSDSVVLENHLPHKFLRTMLDYIRRNPGCTLPQITDQALGPLFRKEKFEYRAAAAHRGVEILHAEELITLKKELISSGAVIYFYPAEN